MLERVMIISGESSGELYGALLAGALKRHNPGIDIVGVGGERMLAAGVGLISRISSAFGLSEALRTYREIKQTYRKVVAALESFNPQVLVLIDYPDFNMKVARAARKAGIKILYYVSPQVWAWRKRRVKVIGKLVDMMAVILPFEEKIYHEAEIPCEFVGHPAMDEIREVVEELGYDISAIDRQSSAAALKAKVREELGLDPDRPVVTLMPGSRPHEVEQLLPVMADVTADIRARYPGYQFVMPLAPNLDESLFSGIALPEACCRVKGQSIKALLAADAAVIASGTSTLQATLLKVPMAVVYRLSPFTYSIGKLIIRVKYISLVNILLGKSVRNDSGLRIRELMQDDARRETIAAELDRILGDTGYRNDMISQMEKVRELFAGKRASSRVSELMISLAGGSP